MILFYQGEGLELKNYGGIEFKNGRYYDVPQDLYSFLKQNYKQVFSSKRVPDGAVVFGLKDARPQPMSTKDLKPSSDKKPEPKKPDKKLGEKPDKKAASSVEEL